VAEPATSSSRPATLALATIAAAPLLLGGFAPFAWASAAASVGIAAATLPAPVAARPSSSLRRLLALGLAAIAIALLQLAPLPSALLTAAAPGAAALDRELGDVRAWAPLSRDPAATRAVALSLLIGLLLLVAASTAAARPDARRVLLAAVAGAAMVVAAVGIAETFLGRPLLRTGLPPHARPFGPFANRNHAAALLLLALPCAVGLARDLDRERRRRAAGALFLGAGVLLLAVVLNGSRGGLAAALLLVGAIALRARGRPGSRLLLGALLGLAIVIPGAGWARRHELTTVEERLTLARDAVAMACDAPWTGIGLGAFGAAYPPHQTVARDLRFRHVESEPIELLVEGGLPLLLVALAAGATIATVCVRAVWRRGAAWADAGGALGVVAVLVHACFDFPLRVPGVVLPLLLVLSAVLAGDGNGAGAGDLPRRRAGEAES